MLNPLMTLVAGPYRSGTFDDPALIAQNVAAMTDTSLQLFRTGHVPAIGEWFALPLIEHAGSAGIGHPVSINCTIRSHAAWSPSAMAACASVALRKASMTGGAVAPAWQMHLHVDRRHTGRVLATSQPDHGSRFAHVTCSLATSRLASQPSAMRNGRAWAPCSWPRNSSTCCGRRCFAGGRAYRYRTGHHGSHTARHRPDLSLAPFGRVRVGLGLWNSMAARCWSSCRCSSPAPGFTQAPRRARDAAGRGGFGDRWPCCC